MLLAVFTILLSCLLGVGLTALALNLTLPLMSRPVRVPIEDTPPQPPHAA